MAGMWKLSKGRRDKQLDSVFHLTPIQLQIRVPVATDVIVVWKRKNTSVQTEQTKTITPGRARVFWDESLDLIASLDFDGDTVLPAPSKIVIFDVRGKRNVAQAVVDLADLYRDLRKETGTLTKQLPLEKSLDPFASLRTRLGLSEDSSDTPAAGGATNFAVEELSPCPMGEGRGLFRARSPCAGRRGDSTSAGSPATPQLSPSFVESGSDTPSFRQRHFGRRSKSPAPAESAPVCDSKDSIGSGGGIPMGFNSEGGGRHATAPVSTRGALAKVFEGMWRESNKGRSANNSRPCEGRSSELPSFVASENGDGSEPHNSFLLQSGSSAASRPSVVGDPMEVSFIDSETTVAATDGTASIEATDNNNGPEQLNGPTGEGRANGCRGERLSRRTGGGGGAGVRGLSPNPPPHVSRNRSASPVVNSGEYQPRSVRGRSPVPTRPPAAAPDSSDPHASGEVQRPKDLLPGAAPTDREPHSSARSRARSALPTERDTSPRRRRDLPAPEVRRERASSARPARDLSPRRPPAVSAGVSDECTRLRLSRAVA